MTSDELFTAITQAQETLGKVDQFLHGAFVNFITTMINKYTADQLLPIFQLINALDKEIEVDDLKSSYLLFQADLNNAQQIDLTNISNAGEWLKNHPLVLRFIANHFTN